MSITLTALQKQRTDTAANWTSANPTLLSGELGFESDTGKAKLGNGSTAWNSLGYLGVIPSSGTYPLSQLIMPLGTAGAPPLTFVGDVNTGIYSPGADQVAISTGGSGRLFVDASGRVGVGSTAYASRITVKNPSVSGEQNIFSVEAATSSATLFSFTTNQTDDTTKLFNIVNGPIAFGTNNTERLRITSTGALNFVGAGTAGSTQAVSFNGSAPVNSLVIDSSGRLGVGTSSPGTKLHIGGETNPIIRINTSENSDTWSTTSDYGKLQFFSQDYEYGGGGEMAAIAVGVGSVFGNGPSLRFSVSNPSSGSANPGERMRLTATGLGIGTTSPQVLLHGQITSTASTNTEVFRLTDNALCDFRVFLDRGTALGNSTTRLKTANGILSFETSDTPRVTIDASGRVGIGTTSPGGVFHTVTSGDNVNFFERTSGAKFGIYNSAVNSYIGTFSNHDLRLATNDQERCRIDTSGRLLVGTSSARNNFYNGANTNQVQIEGTTYQNSGLALTCNNSYFDDTAVLCFNKSATSSIGSNTLVGSTHKLGAVTFQGNDGTEFVEAAKIEAFVDGTPGANDMPGRLVFSTTADGASSPTERMRITQAGFFKATNTAGYISATGSYHELRSSTDNSEALIVSHSGTSGTQYGLTVLTASDQNDATRWFFKGQGATTERFTARSNGGLANYQANNVNLSDRNAKKDISPAAGTWDCIKEWEIVNYRYKDQPDNADLNLGVIAQQVAESCPEVITIFQEAKEAKPAVLDEEGNEVEPAQEAQPERLGVKEQQMYWMAIKALQEAQVRIEALEAEVAALKAS